MKNDEDLIIMHLYNQRLPCKKKKKNNTDYITAFQANKNKN